MPSAFVLLRCIGKAVVKNVVNLFTFGVGGDILVDAWDEWQEASREEKRAADVQALAAASVAEIAAAAAEIVRQEGAGLSDDEKLAVTEYLQQVPPMIRRSQRRPTDPEGKTVRPGATFRKPDDLLPLLPPQAPRFKSGDRPLPGVDWELVELLGRGGFGEVWKAVNPHFGSIAPVALKFCLEPDAKQRLLGQQRLLLHEAAVLNEVMRHGRPDGIVPLLHTYLSADPPCLEYEYIAGGDLAGLIQEHGPTGGMAPPQAARIVQRLAETVGFAHGLNPPIVHRDLKPANILVQARPDGTFALKITDFGIGGLAVEQARNASRQPTRAAFFTSAVLGSYTLLYASPQQMRGEAAHPADDVYALGVIWHQLLSGDVTKGCPTGRGWQKRLTDRGMLPALVDLLIDCFGYEREERPANAAVLAEELARLLDGREKKFTNAIGMKLTLIPAGTFLMGSPDNDPERQANEGPQHEVTISRAFHLGVYPVTQREYEAVMGQNPSHFQGDWFKSTADNPVENVSWEEAVEFCKRLSARAEERQAGRVYRLPTEAEWEYACRAGTKTPFHFGASATSRQANFGGTGAYGSATTGPNLQKTSKVGSYPANAWGLHDMHGNVWEWCADWFAEDSYRQSDKKDPQGPTKGDARVLRGGSWFFRGRYCRAAYRYWVAPALRSIDGGFRVACLSAARTPSAPP